MKKIVIVTSSLEASGANAFLRAFIKYGYDAKLDLISNPNIGEEIASSDYSIFRIRPKSYDDFLKVNKSINNTLLNNNLDAFDKIKTFKKITKANIPTPITEIIRKEQNLQNLKLPVVLKTPRSNQGKDVVLALDQNAFRKNRDRLLQNSNEIIAQEYIAESRGNDVRLIVASDTVVAAMNRQNDNDFRANLHLGGQAFAYNPTGDEKEIAIKAVKNLGVDFAGVDIIHSNRGPLVLEVNPSPGFGISEIVGYDVPTKIVKQLKKKGKI